MLKSGALIVFTSKYDFPIYPMRCGMSGEQVEFMPNDKIALVIESCSLNLYNMYECVRMTFLTCDGLFKVKAINKGWFAETIDV